jgi:hypothetical protein
MIGRRALFQTLAGLGIARAGDPAPTGERAIRGGYWRRV